MASDRRGVLSDDEENPAESTVVEDDAAKMTRGPRRHEGRWDESTVSERERKRQPAEAAAPPGIGEDSARVLLDAAAPPAATPPAPSTPAVDDHPLANMPTAVAPNPGLLMPVPTAGPMAPGRLVVIGGNDRGREFVLHASTTAVGRGTDNDVILTDIAVSRRHISVRFDGQRYSLRDLGSGNGTLVNGVKITGEVFIHDGDQIEIGNTLIRFEQAASSVVTSPPSAPPGPSRGAPPPSPAVLAAPPGGYSHSPATPGYSPAMPAGYSHSSVTPGYSPATPPVPAPPRTAPMTLPASGGPPLPLTAMPSGQYPAPLPPAPATPLGAAGWSPPDGPPPGPTAFPGGTPAMATFDLQDQRRKQLILLGAGAGAVVLLIVVIAAIASSSGEEETVSTEARPGLGILLPVPTPPSQVPPPHVTPGPLPAPTTASPSPGSATPGSATPGSATPGSATPGSATPGSATPASTPQAGSRLPAATPAEAVEITIDPSEEATPPRGSRPAPVPEPPKTKLKAKSEPRPSRPPPEPRPPRISTSAAEKTAAALYRQKQFGKAADTLRAAAEKLEGEAAERLHGRANDYAAVGVGIERGEANASSNPPLALRSLQDALRADERSGDGLHASFLRGQLAKVAPKAALAHMSAGRYEQARAACDLAVNYGVGSDPTVTRVRSMLEDKARQMYSRGLEVERTNPSQAKMLWRRILKMVPADSVWYTKAYAALNKSGR